MAQDIGTAYVQIAPSTRGLSRDIESGIDQGAVAGNRKASAGFFATTAKWVKRAAIVGTGIAAGFAIRGGWNRLLALDDAEGKLRGLGFTASEIAVVMDNALAAVKGTAFGLGDAATAAASATAAGIKPGKELERYLRLIGDAATIGGASFTEMGSIINQVTSRGKAGMENLNRLTERGIPIMEWLAKEYGVSGEALSKMVSKGEVDAATFRKVIEDNIGGAALESGNTFRGAMANLGASLGRIGAGLMGGVFEQLKPAMTELTGALGPLEDAAGRVGAAIGEWVATDGVAIFNAIKDAVVAAIPTVEQFIGVAGRVVGFFKENRAAAIALAAAIGTLMAVTAAHARVLAIQSAGGLLAFVKTIRPIAALLRVWAAAQWAVNLAMTANPIGLIIAAIAALVGGLVLAYKKSETFRKVVDAAWAGIKAVIGAVVDWITGTAVPAFVAAWQWFRDATQPIVDWFKTNVAPVFTALAQLIMANFSLIAQAATWLWSSKIQPVLSLLASGWQAAWTAVSAVWGEVWNRIQAYWKAIGPPLFAAIRTTVDILKVYWGVVWNIISTTVSKAFNIIKGIVQAALAVITGVLKAATAVLRGDWSGAWNAMKGVVSGAWSGIRSTVSAAIGDVVARVRGVKDQIIGAFSGAASWLLNAGKELIQGLIDGIKAMAGKVGSAIGGVASKIKGFLPGSPVKEGPLRSWNNGGAGKRLMTMLADGITDGSPAVQRVMQRAMSDATDMLPRLDLSASPLSLGTAGALAEGFAASGVAGFNQTNHFDHLDPEIAVDLANRRLQSALRGR